MDAVEIEARDIRRDHDVLRVALDVLPNSYLNPEKPWRDLHPRLMTISTAWPFREGALRVARGGDLRSVHLDDDIAFLEACTAGGRSVVDIGDHRARGGVERQFLCDRR